jgi:hypothetical protein
VLICGTFCVVLNDGFIGGLERICPGLFEAISQHFPRETAENRGNVLSADMGTEHLRDTSLGPYVETSLFGTCFLNNGLPKVKLI